MILYVTTPGASISKRDDSLRIAIENTIEEVETKAITSALVLSSVQFSTQALCSLLDCGAPVTVVSGKGKIYGQFLPPVGKHIELRKAQYRLETDVAFSTDMARRIIIEKLANQRESLSRYRRDGMDSPKIKEAVDTIETIEKKLSGASTIDILRGFEGAAAAAYWQAFGTLFKADGVSFTTRQMHPSPDPVNAVLSFGYVLLDNLIMLELNAAGFDPHLGFLHEELWGRPSLALDLLEPYRAPVVDRLVIRLFNLKSLTPDDFKQDDSGGMRLEPPALRVFFREWETRLAKMEIRQRIRDTVWSLRKRYLGESDTVDIYQWRSRNPS